MALRIRRLGATPKQMGNSPLNAVLSPEKLQWTCTSDPQKVSRIVHLKQIASFIKLPPLGVEDLQSFLDILKEEILIGNWNAKVQSILSDFQP